MEDTDLVIRAQADDEAAMMEIMDRYECGVRSIAFNVERKMPSSSLDFDDLMQEGRVAILKAIHEHAPDDDFSFGARVMSEVKWQMWEAVYDDSLIKASHRHAWTVLRVYRRAAQTGKRLSFEEIAERTGSSIELIRDVMTAAVPYASLDEPIGENGGRDRHDVVSSSTLLRSTEDAALAQIEAEERTEAIRQAMQELSDRYRHVFELYLSGLQHADIAEAIGSTEDAAKSIVYRTKKQLRERLAAWRSEEAISYRGVHARYSKSWTACIKWRENGVRVQAHLGTFRTAREAAQAYDEAALAQFGDRAVLNFPKNLESKNKARVIA